MNTNNFLDFIAPLLNINPITAMIYNMNKPREGFIGTEEENYNSYNMPTMPSMPSSMTMPIPMPPIPVQMPPMPTMPTMPSMTNSYNNPALPYIPSPPYVPNNVQTTQPPSKFFQRINSTSNINIYIASVISNIFYTAIMIFALYLSFKCNSGFNFGSFLLASFCSPFYIAYRLAIPCTNTLVNTSRYYR